MLAAGERLPSVSVWTSPRERVTLEELHADTAILLLFYLFDWSST